MQQCSNSIGALAGALAKAQAELTNPEKSMLAVVTADRAGQGGRSFRYAPLSSGLDIVRKTLGKYQLAVVQTTDIDQPTRTVRLTTTLAHASGEWISSDWPVCSLGDVSAPQRMGTALTYARRYALFALVGIAGEDDLEAADLELAGPPTETRRPDVQQHRAEPTTPADRLPVATSQAYGKPRPVRTVLDPVSSAGLRDQLLAACAKLGSQDEALAWARQTLKSKNTLCSTDAGALELAFRAKMFSFQIDEDRPPVGAQEPVALAPCPLESSDITEQPSAPNADQIKEANRMIPPRPRRRDKAHLKFVATHACLVCGRQPTDSHHLRFAQPRALGRKVSDEFTVPLCRSHHRQLHRSGNEIDWWAQLAIDPLTAARNLWTQTRPQPSTGRKNRLAEPARESG